MQTEEDFEVEKRAFEDGIKLWGVFGGVWKCAKHLGEGSKVGEGRHQVGSGRKKGIKRRSRQKPHKPGSWLPQPIITSY